MKPFWLSNLLTPSSCSLHTSHFVLVLGVANKRYGSKISSQSASQKLLADAEQEEREAAPTSPKSSRILLENEHENWTGDESVKDAVLRMLVDKYKPLRYGTIQTAEEKVKQFPPRISSSNIMTSTDDPGLYTATAPSRPASGSWTDEPLLPSNANHRPWHTQFKAPSHDTAAIKVAQLPPPVSVKLRNVNPDDGRTMKKARKKTLQAGKLMQARESTLDYRLGIERNSVARPNPQNMKGWMSLVEDRIESARKAGLFKEVKGRGQPLFTSTAEHNPFIAREEFLMNRIVLRNGAAPPWVEIQGELDSSIKTFRELLRQSWIRHAVRELTTMHPHHMLQRLTPEDIRVFHDHNWLKRERKYYAMALEEVNSFVRKYNGLAPYPVRRPYYILGVEMDNLHKTCVNDILYAIADFGPGQGTGYHRGDVKTHGATGSDPVQAGFTTLPTDPSWKLINMIRAMWDKIMTRWKVQ